MLSLPQQIDICKGDIEYRRHISPNTLLLSAIVLERLASKLSSFLNRSAYCHLFLHEGRLFLEQEARQRSPLCREQLLRCSPCLGGHQVYVEVEHLVDVIVVTIRLTRTEGKNKTKIRQKKTRKKKRKKNKEEADGKKACNGCGRGLRMTYASNNYKCMLEAVSAARCCGEVGSQHRC